MGHPVASKDHRSDPSTDDYDAVTSFDLCQFKVEPFYTCTANAEKMLNINFLSSGLFPSGLAAANQLPPSSPLILCLLFSHAD